MAKTLSLTWVAPAYDGGAAVTSYTVGYTALGLESFSVVDAPLLALALNVADGLIYDVRIRANNESGSGAWSDSISVYAAVPPSPPVIWDHSVTAGQVTFHTNTGDDGGAPVGAHTFTLTNLLDPSEVVVRHVPGSEWIKTVSNLPSPYWSVQATAHNAAGESDAGAVRTNVLLDGEWLTVTQEPVNQTAEEGGTAEFTAQIAALFSGVRFFAIWERMDQGGDGWNQYSTNVYQSGSVSTITLTIGSVSSADNGALFRLRLQVVGLDPHYISNPVLLVVNSPPPVPDAPTGFAVTSGSGFAYLTWDTPEAPAGTISNYVVEVTDYSGTPVPTTLDTTASGFLLGGIDQIAASQYRLAAVNENGQGAWSAALTITPQPAVVEITQQPTSQAAVSGAATFSVVVSVTPATNIPVFVGYQWQKQTAGAGSFSNVGTVVHPSAATSNSLSLSGLTAGDDGDVYRVIVYDGTNLSANATTSSNATLTVPSNAGPEPILLVQTTDGGKLLDQSLNNYWLDGDTSDYGSVVDSYYNYAPAPRLDTSVASPFGSAAYAIGYDGYSPMVLGVRVNDTYASTVAGRRNLLNQIGGGPYTLEMFYRPGNTLEYTYGYGDTYFRVGPYFVMGVFYDQWIADNYPSLPANDFIAVYDQWFNTGGELTYTSTTLTPQAWNHIALVVDTAEIRLYINGSLACTGPLSQSTDADFVVGYANNQFISHVDNVRLVPGAIYSGASIAVPTAPFTEPTRPAANPTTELLLHATHGLEDYSSNRHRVMVYGYTYNGPTSFWPVVTDTQSRFGGTSYEVSPGGGLTNGLVLTDVYAPSNTYWSDMMALLGGASGWTIEMFVRPTGAISYPSGGSSESPENGEVYMAVRFDNAAIAVYDNTVSLAYWGNSEQITSGITLEFYDQNSGISYRISGASLTRDQWHHIALVADTANNLLRLKVDGAEVGTIDITSLWPNRGSWNAYTGVAFGQFADEYAGWYGYLRGHIDDIRISSAALYGAGSYTVPTESLT